VQLILNALLSGSTWLLVGLGFGLVFSTARFFHFAHGAVFTFGAYFCFTFSASLGAPLLLSVVLAALSSGALGCLLELCIYRPLRRRSASPLVLLVASLGAYVLLQNGLSLIFGDGARSIRTGAVAKGIGILGGRLTPVQLAMIVTSAVVTPLLAIWVRRTTTGKLVRAMADDPDLARACGIDTGRALLFAFGIASMLAGLAGTLVALDVDMNPTMGANALMMAVVAVIVGGVGSIPGTALGALLLALAQHAAVWGIGSEWRDTTAFVVLLAFLLLKPHGVMGKRSGRTIV
jgi:branched-chain amino acid transport system permease protein